jgi:RsiW-degrading membrane proteinase PrsW (M82 family)
VVRFISCVALHAVWSGAVGIAAYRVRDQLRDADGGTWALLILRVLAIPMILHGLYDTLLKKEMNAYALLAAVASFAYLAVMVEVSKRREDDAAIARAYAAA